MSVSKAFCAAAVTAAAAVGVFASTATAEPAVVFNTGQGSQCGGTFGGSRYEGFASTIVLNDGQVILHCTAELVEGPGVSETIVSRIGDCTLMANPTGVFMYTCVHNVP